jgi:hypothetical protein
MSYIIYLKYLNFESSQPVTRNPPISDLIAISKTQRSEVQRSKDLIQKRDQKSKDPVFFLLKKHILTYHIINHHHHHRQLTIDNSTKTKACIRLLIFVALIFPSNLLYLNDVVGVPLLLLSFCGVSCYRFQSSLLPIPTRAVIATTT